MNHTRPNHLAGGDMANQSITLLVLALLGGCALVILMVHAPMVRSGFALTQADLLDSRFNNYLFEHSYRWLIRSREHASFWNPPFCYPATNLLAYSDVMISFAPPYWAGRALGLEPDSSFQLWMLTATGANFLLGYLLLRRATRIAAGGAWCGAVLFAAAASRTAQLGHQQLYCQAYVLMTLYALTRMFSDPMPKVRWLALAVAGIVLQFWGGFYMGFFLILTIAIGFTWAAVLPCTRGSLWRSIGAYAWQPLAWVVVAAAAACLTPLALHYLQVSHIARLPDDLAVTAMLPSPKSWLYMGSDSLMYGWLDRFYADLPAPPEHAIGLGLITTMIAVMGLWHGRDKTVYVLVSMVALTLIAVTTRVNERTSLWWTARQFVPGAIAIRAVARIGMLLTIPAAIGFAGFVENLQKRHCATAALLTIVGVCLFEQLRFVHSYDKFAMRREVKVIAAEVPRGAESFFYTGRDPNHWAIDQVDAMWASLQTGVPTFNGYSGTWPPGLRRLIMSDTFAHCADRAAIQRELNQWRRSNDLEGSRVAWIIDDGSGTGALSLSN